MHSLRLFSVILAVFLTFAQVEVKASNQANLIEYLLRNEFAQVKKIEGQKLYLDEEAIVPTAKGTFLCGEDFASISIPSLLSDENGCHIYLSQNELELIGQIWDGKIFNSCPGCGLDYFLICRNPNCPLKKGAEESTEEEG